MKLFWIFNLVINFIQYFIKINKQKDMCIIISHNSWGFDFLKNHKIITLMECKDIIIGSYDCYEETNYNFSVDSCLVKEINFLNNKGINTIGCCCGHGRNHGYIQVIPSHVCNMKNLGYEQLPIDEKGNGKWCFKPKTILK